jgi:hypothetical protein
MKQLILIAALAASIGRVAAADKLEPVDKAWLEENYTKFEYAIPMRDGVKLHTAVYAPKDISTNYPIWSNARLIRCALWCGYLPGPWRNDESLAREKSRPAGCAGVMDPRRVVHIASEYRTRLVQKISTRAQTLGTIDWLGRMCRTTMAALAERIRIRFIPRVRRDGRIRRSRRAASTSGGMVHWDDCITTARFFCHAFNFLSHFSKAGKPSASKRSITDGQRL